MSFGVFVTDHTGYIANGIDILTTFYLTELIDHIAAELYALLRDSLYSTTLDPSSPDKGTGLKVMRVGYHIGTIIILDKGVEPNGNAHFFQVFFGFLAGFLSHTH